jgi:hypothetical protein
MGTPTRTSLETQDRKGPRDPLRPNVSASALRIGLALTSLAAGAIHFAVVSDHADEATSMGIAFAVVAWLQVLWAVAILMSHERRWLLAGAIGNAAIVSVWVISRTSGLPIGPATEREALGRLDLLATLLEVAIVAGCAIAIAGIGRSLLDRRLRGPLTVYGLVVALVTTGTIVTAGPHAHGGAAHGHGATERAGVPAGGPTNPEHGGPPHVHPAGIEPHTDDHDHGGGSVAGVADAGQIDQIRTAMRRYEDVRVARDEGFIRMDGDDPETGAHFGIPEWTEGGAYSVAGDIDLANPEYLMYSKRLTGSWKLVAVAYVADMWEYPEPPTSLVGAPYHEHVWNCIEPEGWTLDEEDWGVVSKEECDLMGNVWSPGGEWMTHVWLIPNPEGVFADWNPDLV